MIYGLEFLSYTQSDAMALARMQRERDAEESTSTDKEKSCYCCGKYAGNSSIGFEEAQPPV